MSWTWQGRQPPPPVRIGWQGWLRVAWRAPLLALVTFGGLAVHLTVRLFEWAMFGKTRPWTPHITRAVCRAAFPIMGMGHDIRGRPISEPGVLLANHVSWLDIFTLNACQTLVFVAKAEVASWPGIGWLARATGTLFIRRRRSDASAQARAIADRLTRGERLVIFPEGTSSDGQRVLPFRSSLFAPLVTDAALCQPVSLIYHAPEGEAADFYGWWGDMAFGPNLLKVLAARRQGRVEVIFHAPVLAAQTDRKTLAAQVQAEIAGGLRAARGADFVEDLGQHTKDD